MRNIPEKYPNPYHYSPVMEDRTNYNPTTNKWNKNGIQLICWLRTPTGRLSKFSGWIATTSQKDFEILFDETKVRLLAYMESTYHKQLKKGYTLDQVYIYSGFKI